MMETRLLLSIALHYFRTVLLLLLFTCGCPLRSPLASSSALRSLGDSGRFSYDRIFSPLFRALSEHGRSRWTPDLKKKLKPEHKYIKYMTEFYKKSLRVQRSLDGKKTHHIGILRLIRPKDECPVHSKEFTMQDLSYNLDQVKNKEQLLKSVLLYSVDRYHAASDWSVCYLDIKEQEHLNQCQLCPDAQHRVNFTISTHTQRRNWLEVDITSFLQLLLKFQRKNMRLLINVTCPEDRGARAAGRKGPLELTLTLRPPSLLLHLNDTSKLSHPRSLISAKAGQRPAAAANTFHKQMDFKSGWRIGRMRRRRRESPKSKRGSQSLNISLPDLLPSSEFPTTDCALYDFRVRFSQLRLDHWIVFPPKYNPRYCRGICPRTMGFIYGSPVHTMVQNIIYEKLDSSVPKPSCIPSHYSPLSVMIFEVDGSYVYKEFEDMVATRCTCR
ncbi:growth/differentiatio [Myripristis murdjan]|uniref:Growth differentiation factor 9 n=1 Tax=Myripristis murdjan TaxID=586833 RepID=A0A667ZD93_9TELE|nr:growth/differentiation factor 9 [Myripristis murdjan]